ncbi:thioredoxin domain-containing protein [Azorhizobium doebereinerae]|uniref:thioredoxin domain-containing protein n=1 Tax=Azorhizobium doebereinerae TaxID=281091 RepID=UPI00041A7610|nr:thioredoxin domain-containing protein [Azorhizobium doebereinerae]
MDAAPDTTPSEASPVGNRLGSETSPYLLQHKDNPVHWQVWASETLERARREDKPILLSVGYAACHWCHVMASESFEDPATAALMNALFIPVKVDREERPDIDAIYQNALALLGQSGGWPLTMFLTPDGEPYWGGTYYPPERRYGRPAFPDILRRTAEVYRHRRPALEKNMRTLREGLRQLSAPPPDAPLTPERLDDICEGLCALIDPVDGGLGQAPKFPHSPVLSLLWRAWHRTGRATFRDAVLLTLERMSQGGIYDHLGGGYARYATDAAWLVPHFEKMLYDNAQLVELLTLAWQETGNPLFAERVAETIGFLLREMRVDGGAFAAALDADSEHEEGKFYVWTAAEVEALLGADAALFKRHYDVHRIGNWEGKSILNRSDKPERAAPEVEARLAAARDILLAARAGRVRPGRDHKVLADWNGLAIAALCRAGTAFRRPEWLAAARGAFAFVTTRMRLPDGRLAHSWCDGRIHPGTLDDYAAMARAALALHQATGEGADLARAEGWPACLDAHFAHAGHPGYFLTPDDAEDLITRIRTATDNATPSGNGVMVEVFATLFHLTGKAAYRDKADAIVAAFAGELTRQAVPFAALLSGFDMLLNAVAVVIRAGDGLEALLDMVAGASLPNLVLTVLPADAPLPGGHPAAGKAAVAGRATAYVCRGETCSLPVTDPQALLRLLPGPARRWDNVNAEPAMRAMVDESR